MNILTSIVFMLTLAQATLALEPPEHGFPRNKNGGITRINPALGIGNSSVAPELIARLSRKSGGAKVANLLAGKQGAVLPAEGRPRILVLLMQFQEYPARPGDTPEVMAAKIFGSAGKFPYESLTAYYRRSSYGKLAIEGNVLGWYNAGLRSEIPQTMEGREALIKTALQSYSDQDFSQYDNNGDGAIDHFAVIWTGPSGEWATFWWAGAINFTDQNFTIGGKHLGSYSWQGATAKWDDPGSDFKIRTLIHETGHALGLPDYYDYSPGVGPDGGLGQFDMMDSTWYDHNCFSKMLLGWTQPQIVNYSGEFKLRPAADSGECIMLIPPGRDKNPFSEFFLVENRRNSGNDGNWDFAGGGIVVWHVDARLDPKSGGFLYNNQWTGHRLLKALEADGLEELEQGISKFFGSADFYNKNQTLGPETLPSSRFYDGSDTGINLLSAGGDLNALFSVKFTPLPQRLQPSRP